MKKGLSRLAFLSIGCLLAGCGGYEQGGDKQPQEQAQQNGAGPEAENDGASEDAASDNPAAETDDQASEETVCPEGWAGEECDRCKDSPCGYMTDQLCHVYKTVTIDGKIWMAENMRYDFEETSHVMNSADYDAKYGLLYSSYVAENICPEGWRLPTKEDFQNLFSYVDDNKRSATLFEALVANSADWKTDKDLIGDEFGLSILPAGYNYNGQQYNYGERAEFWTSTRSDGDGYKKNYYAYFAAVSEESVYVSEYSRDVKRSVRCIRDYNPQVDDICLKTKCEEGFSGPECEFCASGYYGAECQKCECSGHSHCDGGKNGLGCVCDEGWAGEECDIANMCVNGVPNLGKTGDGHCLDDSCSDNSYGLDCEPYGVMNDGASDTYNTIIINGKTWMAENMRLQKGTYYYPDNDKDKMAKYGLLYDWETAKTLCPEGWHLPAKSEFSEFLDFADKNRRSTSLFRSLISDDPAWGTYLCLTGDDFGFRVMPAGHKGNNDSYQFGYNTSFWSTTAVQNENYQGLTGEYAYVLAISWPTPAVDYTDVATGASVRCVRDAD